MVYTIFILLYFIDPVGRSVGRSVDGQRLNNIHMGQHMTAATHLRKAQRVHNLALRRLVDIFRGEVDDLVNIEVARKLYFTNFS